MVHKHYNNRVNLWLLSVLFGLFRKQYGRPDKWMQHNNAVANNAVTTTVFNYLYYRRQPLKTELTCKQD